jgi:hypothetical protein
VSARELRELGLACACHLAVMVTLRTARFKTFLGISKRRLPFARRPLSLPELQRIVSLSRRLCRGSCLTESLVVRLLAGRHGHADVPLTIGVSLTRGVLQAHAWIGADAGNGAYVPLWTESQPHGALKASRVDA